MIINTEEIQYIYIATTCVDMRKAIDGLAAIVTGQFQLEVMNQSLFIFTNRNRNRLKLLYYEEHGFWLFVRRLDKGTFKLYETEGQGVRSITEKQLEWLIRGLEIEEKQMLKSAGKWLNM